MTMKRAIAHVLEMEGGYANDPRDAGGETNFGISKRSFPDTDIKALTRLKASDIYRIHYWDKIKGDELPPPIAMVVLDFAVNSGVARASKLLQKHVGVRQDGAIGPQTVAFTNHGYEKHGMQMLRWYNSDRLLFLSDLSGWKVFGKAWRSRVLSVHAMAVAAHVAGEAGAISVKDF